MRSERREQRRLEKEKKKELKQKNFSRVISVIYSLLAVCFIALIVWLNVLPAKYLYPLIAILVIISIFIVPVMFSKNGNAKRRKGATVAAFVLIVVFGLGTYYAAATLDFFGDITNVSGNQKEDFYLVVKASAPYEKPEELSGETIGVHASSDTNYARARNELSDKLDVEYEYHEELADLVQNLIDDEYPAIFISAASYEGLKDSDSSLQEELRILDTISVKIEKKSTTKHVKVTKEPFNVLVSGIDVEGSIDTVSRSDVNMVVTVNPQTREILMTSIPRDYYVSLPSKNAMDKLTHSGLFGVNETVKAVEELMGIDINYYVKVNYSTVVKLVDAIGGIDIDSPYEFYTHGMTDKYYFSEGYNHLDGSQALAYSRERQSWVDGDLRRNENQQLILEAIIKKATGSSTILSEYTSILGAIKENLETDMDKSDITSIIKMQLNDMASWNIEKQALKGIPDSKECYALGMYASVVDTDEAMIAEAVDKILRVKDGKTN